MKKILMLLCFLTTAVYTQPYFGPRGTNTGDSLSAMRNGTQAWKIPLSLLPAPSAVGTADSNQVVVWDASVGAYRLAWDDAGTNYWGTTLKPSIYPILTGNIGKDTINFKFHINGTTKTFGMSTSGYGADLVYLKETGGATGTLKLNDPIIQFTNGGMNSATTFRATYGVHFRSHYDWGQTIPFVMYWGAGAAKQPAFAASPTDAYADTGFVVDRYGRIWTKYGLTALGTSSLNLLTADSLVLGDGLLMSKDSAASLTAVGASTFRTPLVLTPGGTGGLYLGPKADGTAAGGNVRGLRAVDLQLERTAATQVASGDWSFVAGRLNTASGRDNIAIGFNNQVTATSAYTMGLAIGEGNVVDNSYGGYAIGEGNTNHGRQNFTIGNDNVSTSSGVGGGNVIGNFSGAADGGMAYGSSVNASGRFSTGIGMGVGAKRYGEFAYGLGSSYTTAPDFRVSGVVNKAQQMIFSAFDTTVNASTDTLTLDASDGVRAFGVLNAMTIDSGTVWLYRAEITARSDVGDAGAYTITGAIKRVGATTSMVGTPTITTIAEDVAGWDVTVAADDTNDVLHVLVTGSADKYVRWHATVSVTTTGF